MFLESGRLVQSQIGKINIYNLHDLNLLKVWVQVRLLNVFERSVLCSQRLNLLDQKYSETVILWNITTIKKRFSLNIF